MPSASAAAIRCASAPASIMVPVGLAGLATTRPASGFFRCSAISALADSAQRVSAEVSISTGSQPSAREDMPVWRIAGIGQGHPVARLEQRQERQHETARRTGGDHHARRVEREAVGVAVMAGDSRPQAGDAERLGIADAAVRQRRLRRLPRRRRRGRRRLAHLHMQNVGTLGLQSRRRGHHVHDDERRHIAAFGRHWQAFCYLMHR